MQITWAHRSAAVAAFTTLVHIILSALTWEYTHNIDTAAAAAAAEREKKKDNSNLYSLVFFLRRSALQFSFDAAKQIITLFSLVLLFGWLCVCVCAFVCCPCATLDWHWLSYSLTLSFNRFRVRLGSSKMCEGRDVKYVYRAIARCFVITYFVLCKRVFFRMVWLRFDGSVFCFRDVNVICSRCHAFFAVFFLLWAICDTSIFHLVVWLIDIVSRSISV